MGEKRRRRIKIHDGFLFTISMALLAFFCYSVTSRLLFLARAERDIAVVRALSAENGRCGGKRKYRCTKFFATVDVQSGGSRLSSRIKAGAIKKHDQPVSRAFYRPGDRVPVFFNPDRPEEIVRDKLWDLWGPSSFCLILLLFLLTLSFRDPDLSEPATLKLNGWER